MVLECVHPSPISDLTMTDCPRSCSSIKAVAFKEEEEEHNSYISFSSATYIYCEFPDDLCCSRVRKKERGDGQLGQNGCLLCGRITKD